MPHVSWEEIYVPDERPVSYAMLNDPDIHPLVKAAMVIYGGKEPPLITINAWEKRRKAIGTERFLSILTALWAEVRAGETLDSMGAGFMARLNQAVNQATTQQPNNERRMPHETERPASPADAGEH